MQPVAYVNGSWVPADQATVSISDRGFLYGDGVFETARVHTGRFFRLDHHLQRLQSSAQLLHLDLPPLEQLRDIALQLARLHGYEEASLRITATRGSGGRGLHRAGTGPPTIIATLSPLAPDWRERAARGWRIMTSTFVRPATSSVPAQLKGLGRTYALLAHFEAEDAGFDDALLLSAEGYVAEGPTWNVFWRIGRMLCTPALGAGILAGVTRTIILHLATAAGYEVKEDVWPRSILDQATEVFATMTSSGIVPVKLLDQRALMDTEAAERLQREYWALVRKELGQTE